MQAPGSMTTGIKEISFKIATLDFQHFYTTEKTLNECQDTHMTDCVILQEDNEPIQLHWDFNSYLSEL